MNTPLPLSTAMPGRARCSPSARRPLTSATVGLFLLVLLLLAVRLPAAAQAPAWQSARAVAAAASFSVPVAAMAVDATGNVYLTGNFSGTLVLGGTTLTSSGGTMYVAKFNPASNQFVWAQQATNNPVATALAVSGTSVYVAGNFRGTPAFGATTLTSVGDQEIFVAKLTDAGSTGSFAWAQRAGSLATSYALAVAASGTNVYVTGAFGGPTASFGPITLTNATAFVTLDAFVAKLTDAGNTGSFVWAQRAGGTDYEWGYALAVSGTSVYMAGYFTGSTTTFGATTLTGGPGGYVAKFTDAGGTGSFAWVQRTGKIGTAVAASGSNVYVAGYFDGVTAPFGATVLTNAGAASSFDAFVAKLTDAGTTGSFVWAQRAGGTGNDFVRALAVSGSNVYMAGEFISSTAPFGATTLTNVGASGSADVFTAKLVDAGGTANFAWAQQAGGTDNDYARAVGVSGNSVYMAGYILSPSANFSTTTITSPTANASLGFLASLTDPTLTATTTGQPLAPAQLYPNPAHHTATLRLPAGTAPAPLTLTDALGRAVRAFPAPIGPEATLDLRGLPAGLYLLRGAGPAQRLAVE